MNEHPHSQILIVDDDELACELARAVLEARGYAVDVCTNGRDGFTMAERERPALILLDRSMPGMDGLEVLARIRSHLFLSYIPVILLTGKASVAERVAGLEAGADDYVVKPFDHDELAARVEALLRRNRRDLVADPLTMLPGNVALRTQIARWIDRREPFSLAYVDLDHFKNFVDHHGFERGSQVIQKVGQVIYNTVVDLGDASTFIGHIGGDDFMLLLQLEEAERVCRAIIERFAEAVVDFYDQEELARGYSPGVDRYGTPRDFPLTRLSAAIIDAEPGDFSDRDELAAFAVRCKEAVKQLEDERCRRYRLGDM